MSRAVIALVATAATFATGCRSAPERIYVTPPFAYEHAAGDSPRIHLDGTTCTLERARLGTVRIRTRRIHVYDPLHLNGNAREDARRVDVEPGSYPVYFAGSTNTGTDIGEQPLFVLSLRAGTPARWFVDVHRDTDRLIAQNGRIPFYAADSHMAAVMDAETEARYSSAWSGRLDQADLEAWDAVVGIAETTLGGFGINRPFAALRSDARFRESQAYWVRRGLRINFETESDILVCYGQACGTIYWGVNDRDEAVCMVLRFE